VYLLTAAIKKKIKATAKGMDGQSKLTAHTIPAHHVAQTNFLKSEEFLVLGLDGLPLVRDHHLKH